MAQNRIFLKDYQQPSFWISKVDLRFDLFEDHADVTAVSQVEANPKTHTQAAPLVLDGTHMELLSVQVDGRDHPHELGNESLTLRNLPKKFELAIRTRIKPQENKAYEGLYRSGDVFVTQCEAHGFRRITYFLDRPDNMAVYTSEITADKKKYPHLLSNGNPVGAKDLEGGRHWVKWSDPFRKPCYLFALVAGNLDIVEDQFTTRSGRKIRLQIYVDKGRTDRCSHAMESLKKSMKWDEDRYGLEYDLDLFMIVAVDAFNMGAMENKGLNIFNSKYILADSRTATDRDYANIEGVVGHEYFHNWTGNRVTCRDWFQLSLKEGLTVYRDQEFSADMLSRAVQRIDDVTGLRAGQFEDDAGPNAHPVRPDSVIAVDNFYTSTIYEKGAELIRMIEVIVGRDGFRKGMDKYFELYDGQAVTTDDFVHAMEVANQVDLTQFKRWYVQAGTPVVHASDRFDEKTGTYTLKLRQTCPPTPRQPNKEVFHIPLKFAAIGSDGRESVAEQVLHLKRSEEEYVFSGLKEKPVPSFFRDFSAPVRLEYSYTENDLLHLMKKDTNSFNRFEAAQSLFRDTWLHGIRSGGEIKLSDKLSDAFGAALRESAKDPLYYSRLLRLPTYSYLTQYLDEVDPALVFGVHDSICDQLAVDHESALYEVYERNRSPEPYRFNARDMGARSLKNFCLRLLVETGKKEHFTLAVKQYESSGNMTDQLAAMAALADHDIPERHDLFDRFYSKWSTDPVVMIHWFGMQASSELPNTLDRVREIMKLPAFKKDMPNHLYSLIGGFGGGNPVQFHRPDGEPYRFMVDMIQNVDAKNPQVGARLVGVFDTWKKHTPVLREKAESEMRRLLATPGLSPNTYELLSNALGIE